MSSDTCGLLQNLHTQHLDSVISGIILTPCSLTLSVGLRTGMGSQTVLFSLLARDHITPEGVERPLTPKCFDNQTSPSNSRHQAQLMQGGQSSFELSTATQTHNRELSKSFLRSGVNSWVTAAHEASCPLCTASATYAGESDGSPSLCKLRFWCTLVLLTAWFSGATYTLRSTGKHHPPQTLPHGQHCSHQPTAESNRD